jgi:RsiW-degrading membrane proteinase PrsW (M82 family)
VSFGDRLLALLGVVPPFLFLWWVERFERRVLEPSPDWRYRVLAAGGFVSVPVLLIGRVIANVLQYLDEPLASLYEAFIIAGLLEETAKAACIFLLTRGALAPRTRYGALLYALHASMGFAVVENVIALLSTPDLESLTQRFILRAYLAVPMHLTTGGVLGYLLARKRFDGGALGGYAGLALAILVHGTFDALLYAIDRLPDEAELAQTVCAYVVFLFPAAGVLTLWSFARRLRALDGANERKQPRGRRDSVPTGPVAPP